MGATVSLGFTVIPALDWEPADPTAYTVCAPAVIPVGIVTENVEVPLNGIGEVVTVLLSTVPLVALSSRKVIVSPVT